MEQTYEAKTHGDNPVATARPAAPSPKGETVPGANRSGNAYVVPMAHVSLPAYAMNLAFWGALVGSVALGAVDPPLAALIGAGVIVARHRSR